LKQIPDTMEATRDQKRVVYESAQIEAHQASEALSALIQQDNLCDQKYQFMSFQHAKMALAEEMHRTRKRETVLKYEYLEAVKQLAAARKKQHGKRMAINAYFINY
jgi:hypothetical protein